jgi:katanin p60 ATPase-containing subunit A1
MFELARYHAPSTIFLDELDALASHRDASREHEGSRRLKAELLIQLDGLAHSEDKVFFLATSNLPWQVIVSLFQSVTVTHIEYF